MLRENLVEFFERDLIKLREEIMSFGDDRLWTVRGTINNSAGTLCLHLCGNLKHFIGAVLGDSGYVRQRDLEFSLRNLSKDELLKNIDETTEVVKSTLNNMKEPDFEKIFPLLKHERTVTTGHMLIHLFGHLNYHLGQVNYLRRCD